MAKKLLGERQIGDVVYEKGKVISDDDFAKSGLTAADVQAVADTEVTASMQQTPAAQTDADAEVDAQAAADAEKKEGHQSAQLGSEADASATGSENGGASTENAETGETVEYVLTEQDFIDNADLAAQGHKVGETVRVPKGQVQE